MTISTARPPALYGSLNARQLSFAEIGRAFVAPSEFEVLCRPTNHVLLGPRGSGKTMLMKMLSQAALDEWRPIAGDEYIAPAFIGVYIPADLLWARTLNQYWASAPQDTPDGTAARQLIQCIITLNVLESLATAIAMLEDPADGGERELALVEDLAAAWHLTIRSHSFYRLQQAIRERATLAASWLEQVSIEGDPSVIEPEARNWLTLDPLRLVGLGISATCHHLGIPADRRWALCFDELEIAPAWLREYVVGALRSTDQRLLFKLSASPMQALATEELFPSQSQQLHDYSIIKLWHAGVTDARPFCEGLATRFVSDHFAPGVTPRDVFLRSNFATLDEEADETYHPGSDFWRRVKELAAFDPGLRRLLHAKGISLSRLGHIAQKDKDEVVRKLKPIVMLRHAFLKPDPARGNRAVRRSRKVTSLYTGVEAIYAACDGNPRWLTGMLMDMASRRRGDRVGRAVQASVIEEASDRFLMMLAVMPESTQIVHNKTLSVRAVLEAVGTYFEDLFLGAGVSLDPRGSFIVDSDATDELVDLIRMAATQGAVVYLDPKNIDLNSNPRGKRFRLSFLLAPAFHLPFRVYDHVPLSRCLGSTVKSQLASDVFEFEQAELFAGAE